MKIISPRILIISLIVIIVSLSVMAVALRKDRVRTEQTVIDIETTAVERMHVTAIEKRLGAPLPPSAQPEYYRHAIGPYGEEHLLRLSIPDTVWQQYVDDTNTIPTSYYSSETHLFDEEIDADGVQPMLDVEPLVEFNDDVQIVAQETRTIVIRCYYGIWDELHEPTVADRIVNTSRSINKSISHDAETAKKFWFENE